MKFSELELDPRLLKNLEAMGFIEATPIQTQAIPPGLAGSDILGSAETGTGKTLAFLLPILDRLIREPSPGRPRALILAPTRELALQVADHAAKAGRGLKVSTVTVYGGVGYGEQEQALRAGVDIVIATPGRLIDLIGRGWITFERLEVFVLDEADRMLDAGFKPDIERIVKTLPAARQTMLFSATLRSVRDLAKEVTKDAVRVDAKKTAMPTGIVHVLYPVPEHIKPELLRRLLEDEGLSSVLVFTRTKQRSEQVARKLNRAGLVAAVIHGDRSQRRRVAALESFRQGKVRILVATDVAARGLDIEGVSHVVNYDAPADPKMYVHRVGRTGRATAAGRAITLMGPADETTMLAVQQMLGRRLPKKKISGLDYYAPSPREGTPAAGGGRRKKTYFGATKGRKRPEGPGRPERR